MNSNFSLPTLATLYPDFLTQMKSRDEDVAIWFDGSTATNILTGTKRWNSTGNKFEKFNGTAWSDLATLYNINVATANNLNGGNNTTLLGSIPYQSNTYVTSLLAPNTSTTRKFLRQAGTGTNGAAPAWDTIAVGDIPTLNQNTSGNAGTATKLAASVNINGKAFDGSANIDIEDRIGTAIASATTITIGTAGLGEYIHITGTTTITSLGNATTAGTRRTLIFDGALTLTHNATSLICPGATSITTVAGMVIEVIAETTSNWRVISIYYPLVSASELGYLDGVTSNIQQQVNNRALSTNPTLAGKATLADITVNVTSGTYTSAANIVTVVLNIASHTVSVGDFINVKGITNVQASTGGSNVQFNGYHKVTAQTATTVTFQIATLLGTITSTALSGIISFTNGGFYLDSLPKIKTATGYIPLQGATAWVVWDNTTTTPTILASSNISGIVRTVTGQCIVYFENLMDISNYISIYSANTRTFLNHSPTTSKVETASGYPVDLNGNTAYQNAAFNCLVIFGGKN